MRGALRIGRVSGIGIYIHWSFAFLLVWAAWLWGVPVLREHGWTNEGIMQAARPALFGVVFILSIFVCVVLHELGHALAAKRYGVKTRDITLWPFGGIARLERIPENPGQEIVVALAGPAVNVVIAIMIYLGLAATNTLDSKPAIGAGGMPVARDGAEFLVLLMGTNIFLVIFNLIPAFPMDGGRVLRALLGYRFDFAKATRIAAVVGQMLAVLFVIWGLMSGHWLLMIIGIFVFLGAGAESQMAQVRGGLSGIPVRDAMITQFITLTPEDTLARASEALLAGSQQDFPVLAQGNFVGILPRAEIVQGLAQRGTEARVGDVMRRECPMVTEYDMVFRVFQMMQESDCPVVPVLRNGDVVGLVTMENIGELMMIRSALGQNPARPAGGRIQPLAGT